MELVNKHYSRREDKYSLDWKLPGTAGICAAKPATGDGSAGFWLDFYMTGYKLKQSREAVSVVYRRF